MDIRTRLSLALVAVSLVSMALLGIFAYVSSYSLLREISLRQLDALAESKHRDLTKVYSSWEDQLRLVRERPQLRNAIRAYTESNSKKALAQIETTIGSAILAVSDITKLVVITPEGQQIASSGNSAVPPSGKPVGAGIDYVGTFVVPEEGLRVMLSTPVRLDGQIIGGLEMIVNAQDLYDITSDHTGLDETGEVLVIMQTGKGLVQILNPLRHAPEAKFIELAAYEFSDEVLRVFEGLEVSGKQDDYRGEAVLFAGRLTTPLNWGMIVKVDVAEEDKRADLLRDRLVDIALALSAFALIGGGLLGFYLARPITDLALVVERLRQGEGGVRAEVKGDDEIAYLAESMNELLDQLEADSKNPPTNA